MDILDFVPFLEFIRNDEETISIIAEASVVIPKVCDILGISLSFAEAEEDARNENEESGSGQARVETGSDTPGSQDNQRPRQEMPSASMTLQNIFNSHAKDSNRSLAVTSVREISCGLRKRGPETGANSVTEVTARAFQSNQSAAESSRSAVLPPKKRRVDSSAASESSTRATCTNQNSANPDPVSTEVEPTDSVIYDESLKEKMRQDLDAFNDSIRQLAALERQKNQLLESLLKISTVITQQPCGSQENDAEEAVDEAETSGESDISDDEDDDEDCSDFDSDELSDEEDEELEETETTEVVEEQIVSLDMMDVIHHDEPNSY